MLRNDIRRATAEVLLTLEETNLLPVLKSFLKESESRDAGALLLAFRRYATRYEGFGESEKQLIAIMELSFLNDVDFWSSLVSEAKVRSPDNYGRYESIKFFQEHLPKLLSLVERESDGISESRKKGKERKGSGLSRLSLTVIEDHQLSSPERLVLALESIDGLYRACAQLVDESEGDLCVIACDSGSDKSFDFLGVAKVVECVKQVILSFWDKIVYFREDKTGRRLELVAQSLPILDEIASMKESGKLEPERAELIKKQVIESVTKFAAAGVTIPEIENFTVFDPRQLMKPEPKLLVAPRQAVGEAGKGEEESKEPGARQINDPEFQEYMARMAREFLEGKAGSTDASKTEHADGPDDEAGTATESGEG